MATSVWYSFQPNEISLYIILGFLHLYLFIFYGRTFLLYSGFIHSGIDLDTWSFVRAMTSRLTHILSAYIVFTEGHILSSYAAIPWIAICVAIDVLCVLIYYEIIEIEDEEE